MSKHINNEFLKLYYIVWLRMSLFLNKYFQIFKLFIVTQHLLSAVHQINHYPGDKFEWNQLHYPPDRDLFVGWHYLPFKQIDPITKLLKLMP